MKITREKTNGITLIALIVTIVILLILVGVAIASLDGENGLFANVKLAKKAHTKAEMKEQLVLALSELQLEKNGEATLDDVTQEWANNKLKDYEPMVKDDASISGKKITMKKSGIVGKYIIDEKLNIIEQEETTEAMLTYEVKSRDGENLQVLVTVTDNENGLQTIEYNDGHIQNANGLKSSSRDCIIQLGVEYKVKIISKNGEEKTETILINDYYHTITKNLGEGINIDNVAVKAAYNKPYQATLTTGNEYIIETLTVTMGGQEVTVDKTTGIINIEKVTGDIEITATSKKLEIITTQAYVNTMQNATSSAATNSVDKSQYKLYVSFTATLEGQSCTIEPSLTQAIASNGKYTYTITGTYQGKTITTTKEVTVDQYKAAKNLVAYNAGDWTETEINNLGSLYNINASKTSSTAAGLNFTFGGFTYAKDNNGNTNTTYANEISNGTVVTSRNQSVAPQSGYAKPQYEGWQILEIKDSSGNVIKNETEINNKLNNLNNNNEKIYVTKIVHAGCPENFVYCYTTSIDAYRAEYILSSGLRQTGYSTYSPRSWQMYIDDSQKNLIADTVDKDGKTIKDIHAMTYDEAYAITGSIGGTNGIRNTGSYYWLGSGYRGTSLWYVVSNGLIDYCSGVCMGVRPVVSLKSGVYIASGDGTETSPYVLVMETTE